MGEGVRCVNGVDGQGRCTRAGGVIIQPLSRQPAKGLTSCCLVLRMTRFTDIADYDAGETSGNVLNPRSDAGTKRIRPSRPGNTIKLREWCQTAYNIM
ncbi:unnamed protein product [Protopolystoma xenopodis]|uniref:Uncharacterized protein n=1 Tax=Protopolystoma xenopodis TaxID=117903 RepID=A0A3S5CUH9_9PLAT|nr:unnamed protein product [Protopolystoma xenopodis]